MNTEKLILKFVLDTIDNATNRGMVDAMSEIEHTCRVLSRLVDKLPSYAAEQAVEAVLGGDHDAE